MFELDRKKIIIAISVLAIVLLAIIAVYFIFYRQAPEAAPIPGGLLPAAGERPAGAGGEGVPAGAEEAKGIPKAKLIQLSDASVAGAKPMKNGRIRYVERATGHIYEIDGYGENKIRISNVTIPGIFSAHWSKNGDKAVLGYLSDESVKYFSTLLAGTTTTGVFLPPNAIPWSYSSAKDLVLYSIYTDGKYSLISATPQNSGQTELYSTTFANFVYHWQATNTISALTKPSGLVPGYLYKLDAAGGNLDKIMGDMRGLEYLWQKGGNKILISQFLPGSGKLSSQVIDDAGQFLSFGPATLAGKCAWSAADQNIIYCGVPKEIKSATYPDDWYKGVASFDDKIQKINAATGDIKTVLDEQGFDISAMWADENGLFLYFTDKNDDTLWSFRLE